MLVDKRQLVSYHGGKIESYPEIAQLLVLNAADIIRRHKGIDCIEFKKQRSTVHEESLHRRIRRVDVKSKY